MLLCPRVVTVTREQAGGGRPSIWALHPDSLLQPTLLAQFRTFSWLCILQAPLCTGFGVLHTPGVAVGSWHHPEHFQAPSPPMKKELSKEREGVCLEKVPTEATGHDQVSSLLCLLPSPPQSGAAHRAGEEEGIFGTR